MWHPASPRVPLRLLRQPPQTKEAKEGGKFAEEEYEKYRQAAKEAKENYLTGLKKHDEERQDLDSEKASVPQTQPAVNTWSQTTQQEESPLHTAGRALLLLPLI